MCFHDPAVNRADCGICSPRETYSWQEGIFEGSSIFEVLREGEPWRSDWDEHFRFGPTVAAMITFAILDVERFSLAADPSLLFPHPLTRTPEPGLTYTIQTFNSFPNSRGDLVNEPFMKLQRYTSTDNEAQAIGFGRRKATALAVLQRELATWMRRIRA
jgi:hypothetical protein